MDRSNYVNGGNRVPDHMDLDPSLNRDITEEKQQDQNTDAKME